MGVSQTPSLFFYLGMVSKVKTMWDRAVSQLVLATIVVTGLAGCSGSSSSGDSKTGQDKPSGNATSSSDKIKIGIVASISGDQKAWGEDSVDGAKIAIDEFNKAGGLDGKQVELEQQDSASKAEAAKTAAERLISDGVVAIVGEVSSGNTIQIAKSAKDKGLPVVAIGATRTDLTEIGPNVFRVCYTDDFQGPVMAKFAYDKLGLRKVGLMTDNKQPYSQYLSKAFGEKFKQLGGQVVDEVFYETGQSQFGGQLTELKAKNPDGVFMSGYFPEVGPISRQARDAGLTKAVFMGGDGWDSPQLLESGDKAIIGSFFCNHYTNSDTKRPQVGEFLEKWKKLHGGKLPGTTMGALGYDAMAVTLDGLKRAKSTDAKKLVDAIEATEKYPGVSGDITLKGMHGNPPKRAIVVEVRPLSEGPNWQKYATEYTPDQVK